MGWVVERPARHTPDKPAVLDGDVTYTYAQLERRLAGLGTALGRLGVGRGDVVGALLQNGHRHLELWLGVPRHGAVLNLLNYRLAVPELAEIAADCSTKVLVVDDAHLEVGRRLAAGCPSIGTLVYAGDGSPPDGTLSYEALVAEEPEPMPDLDGDTLAGIFYTGGTTGRPKGAMLTHANLLANAKHMLISVGHRPSDRYLHMAPMFHLADGSQTYATTWVGGTHLFVPSFTPEGVAEIIERQAASLILIVPTMINMLVNHPEASTRDFSSLRALVYGSSPMPLELQRRAMKILDCDWYQAYGMTEILLVTTLGPEDHRRGAAGEEPYATRLRSAGLPNLGCQVEVRRPDGSRAGPGEAGEIWARGPTVMPGYWNRPTETAAALTADGWMRTGDAAYQDADGYVFVVDRVKDMIITGAENVYSSEVENAIYTHPAVLEAAVIGVPDPKWGERVHAVVVPKPGATLTEDDLVAHCRQLIAGYKLPRSVEVRAEALPKSGAGKILKAALREPHWAGQARRVH